MEFDLTLLVPVQHHKRSQVPLSNAKRQHLLNSLRFKQMDTRQMTIKTAHARTCRWFLKNTHHLDWLDANKIHEHNGFLWIKGNAGTGKSTLMKFALVNARKAMRDRIVLSFFSNARGEDTETSTVEHTARCCSSFSNVCQHFKACLTRLASQCQTSLQSTSGAPKL